MRPNLLERWITMWDGLGAKEDPLPYFEGIVARYKEPGRRYHTLGHITCCFIEYDEVAYLASNPHLLAFKIFLHDVFYTIGRKEEGPPSDEAASAGIAVLMLAIAGINSSLQDDVRTGILCTTHKPEHAPATFDDKLLVDIDLSIIGQSEKRFAWYERRIREEFSWVPEEDFRMGRANILASFDARSPLYYNWHFQNKFERRAHRNLKRSIKELGGSP
jgi:predicted metal-dependent HD superfamily phosphohydrolase